MLQMMPRQTGRGARQQSYIYEWRTPLWTKKRLSCPMGECTYIDVSICEGIRENAKSNLERVCREAWKIYVYNGMGTQEYFQLDSNIGNHNLNNHFLIIMVNLCLVLAAINYVFRFNLYFIAFRPLS